MESPNNYMRGKSLTIAKENIKRQRIKNNEKLFIEEKDGVKYYAPGFAIGYHELPEPEALPIEQKTKKHICDVDIFDLNESR